MEATMTFEETVHSHHDTTPDEFWTNALRGWAPLSHHYDQTGEVAHLEFFADMVDSALWLLAVFAHDHK